MTAKTQDRVLLLALVALNVVVFTLVYRDVLPDPLAFRLACNVITLMNVALAAIALGYLSYLMGRR